MLLRANSKSLCLLVMRLFVRMSLSCINTNVTASRGRSVGSSQFAGKNSTVLLILVACVVGM